MIKKDILVVTFLIIILLLVVTLESYAFFAVRNNNIMDIINNTSSKGANGMVFSTLYGEMNLNIEAINMLNDKVGSIAAENSTTLTVNFQANMNFNIVCTYDIIYEWLSDDKYQIHSPGGIGKEFTIQASLDSSSHVHEGSNYIKKEMDLVDIVGNNQSKVVIEGAQIESEKESISTAVWHLTTRFYNTSADQSYLAGLNFSSRFNVANVKCTKGIINNE